MATAWPSLVAGDMAADKAVRTGRVADLATRDLVLAAHPFAFYFVEVSTASASFATVASNVLYVPDWAELLTLSIRGSWDIRTTAGTATYRITDNASGNASNEVTTTSATYVRSGDIALAVPAGWGGTQRTINVQAKTTSGTCYSRSTDLIVWRFSD